MQTPDDDVMSINPGKSWSSTFDTVANTESTHTQHTSAYTKINIKIKGLYTAQHNHTNIFKNTILLSNLQLSTTLSVLQEKPSSKEPASQTYSTCTSASARVGRGRGRGRGCLRRPPRTTPARNEWTNAASSPSESSCSADTHGLHPPPYRWSAVSGQSTWVSSEPNHQKCHAASSLKIRVVRSSYYPLYKILKCLLTNTKIPLTVFYLLFTDEQPLSVVFPFVLRILHEWHVMENSPKSLCFNIMKIWHRSIGLLNNRGEFYN